MRALSDAVRGGKQRAAALKPACGRHWSQAGLKYNGKSSVQMKVENVTTHCGLAVVQVDHFGDIIPVWPAERSSRPHHRKKKSTVPGRDASTCDNGSSAPLVHETVSPLGTGAASQRPRHFRPAAGPVRREGAVMRALSDAVRGGKQRAAALNPPPSCPSLLPPLRPYM